MGEVATTGRGSTRTHPSAADRALPLRERKKQRIRRTLAETALRLFREHGYHETTLEQLVDAAEVSTRTFFRYYPSKEAVAMAAEHQLWDEFLAQVAEAEIDGTVLDTLRHALIAALRSMDEEWERRFIATRWLAAHTPELRDHSALTTFRVQHDLVETLEDKLGIDGRADVRLRLVCEFTMSAWRCAAKNWVRSGRHRPDPGKRATIVRRVEEAFDAIPASLAFAAPAGH